MSETAEMAHVSVLLLAHGSPDSPGDVPKFLTRVTGGRALPPEVIEEVERRYRLIGRSPLTDITLNQGRLLAAKLRLPVYVGMRNWHPYIADVLRQMVQNAARYAVVVCLAPQNSRTSVGLYRAALRSCADPELRFDFVESWHDQPQLIQAFAEKLRIGRDKAQTETGKAVPVIFTAHSVPARTILGGDSYESQARETAQLVAAAAHLEGAEWRFAFQSQGMSGGLWLGPTVESTILDLKRSGYAGVFIQPIGFLCDHVEVLYDIDIVFKQFAEQEGMRLWRADSLNDSPLLISALADIANARLGSAAGSASRP